MDAHAGVYGLLAFRSVFERCSRITAKAVVCCSVCRAAQLSADKRELHDLSREQLVAILYVVCNVYLLLRIVDSCERFVMFIHSREGRGLVASEVAGFHHRRRGRPESFRHGGTGSALVVADVGLLIAPACGVSLKGFNLALQCLDFRRGALGAIKLVCVLCLVLSLLCQHVIGSLLEQRQRLLKLECLRHVLICELAILQCGVVLCGELCR
jgi:hypothetical protein